MAVGLANFFIRLNFLVFALDSGQKRHLEPFSRRSFKNLESFSH